jgi:hypothetical protein
VPAAARAAVASRGREVRTTEAVMVRGRSASWSSSGIGAASADAVRLGTDDIVLLLFLRLICLSSLKDYW